MLRIAILLLWAGGALAQSQAPVIFEDRELWMIKAPVGGMPVVDRARDVQANLEHAAKDTRLRLEEARDIGGTNDTLLLLGRYFLFVVTEEDARLEGMTRAQLYAARRKTALEAIRQYRQARSAKAMFWSLGIALGIAVVTVLLFVLLRAAYRKAIFWLAGWFTKVVPGGRLGAIYTLFRSPVRIALLLAVRTVFLVAAAMILLTALSTVLGLFPATRHVSAVAMGSAWNVARDFGGSVVSYLPNLLVLALVYAFTYGLIRISRALRDAIGGGAIAFEGFHKEWAAPTHDLMKVLLMLFGLVVAFPYLPGGDSPALRGASIFVGVLVSLGSGSAMGNVISGVILTYMRPFNVGDRVKIGDAMGDVVEKSLLVTRVRTIKNVEIIVPNSAILGGQIHNFSAEAAGRGLILNTSVTIGYDAPWPRVHELLVEAALRTTHVLAEPRPFVLQTSLNDFHVSYEINAFTREANRMADIYSELHRNIQETFHAGGVEIMSPGFLALRDGNTVAIPESHRPAGYKAPAFRVATPELEKNC